MSNLKPKKIGENEYQIDADSSLGMKVPVTIYACLLYTSEAADE